MPAARTFSPRVCKLPSCGQIFTPNRENQMYCSTDHYQKHYRDTHKPAATSSAALTTTRPAAAKAERKQRGINQQLRDDIERLRNQGYSHKQVAATLGITTKQSTYYMVRLRQERGMEPRPWHHRTKPNDPRQGKVVSNGNSNEQDSIISNHVSYAFGRTEAWLEAYADSAGISRSALARQLGELLLRKARR